MKKSFLFPIVLLFSLNVFSQEIQETANPEKESDSMKKENSEEKTDSELPKENFFTKILDWFEEQPFSFDLGCEPTDEYGSTTFGALEYRWNKNISSELDFEYSKEEKIDKYSSDNYSDITDSNKTEIYFKFLPYKKRFRFSDRRQKLVLGFGARLEYALINTNNSYNYQDDEHFGSEFFINKQSSVHQKIFDVGPSVQLDYSFPIFNWLTVNAENTLSFCYLHMRSDITTEFQNMEKFSSGTILNNTFQSVFFNTKVHLDIFRIVGIIAQYKYERIPMNYLFYDNTSSERIPGQTATLKTEEFNCETQKFRIGAAIIATRKSYVRIQTGFYREYSWIKNHSGDTDKTSRWIFSASARF